MLKVCISQVASSRMGQYFFRKQNNRCFHLILAEAATSCECGCSLFDAAKDGVDSIVKYLVLRI